VIKNFMKSHAGKGTFLVYLAALMVLWPPLLTFIAAGACIVLAVREFRESFRQIDKDAARRRREEAFDATVAVNIAARGVAVPAVVEPAAQSAAPGQEPLPEWLRLPA